MTPRPAPPTATLVLDDAPDAQALATIDQGLGEANDAAAPLHEVAPLALALRDTTGQVLGGALGRSWHGCCELQQLWVHPGHRRRGLGARLLQAFEDRARQRGCDAVFLETFSFQAPHFYAAQGYARAHDNTLFPHGIVKHLMVKRLR